MSNKKFNLNYLLAQVYEELASFYHSRNVELIFDMEGTIPRVVQGDAHDTKLFLVQLLHFVASHTYDENIILHIFSNRKNIDRREILFKIDTSVTTITQIKAISFFQVRLNRLTERLNANISYDVKEDKIFFSMMFELEDIVNQRQYRLPEDHMVGKKALVLCKNIRLSQSVSNMLRYFLYEVDEDVEEYKKRGSNLKNYDLFILDRMLFSDEITRLVWRVQQEKQLKFVIIDEKKFIKEGFLKHDTISAYLAKPILQESIFHLIVLLFSSHKKTINNKPIISLYKDQNIDYTSTLNVVLQDNRKKKEKIDDLIIAILKDKMVLDIHKGQSHAMNEGYSYQKLLEEYFEKFYRSDYYLCDIISGKAEWQTETFLKDLEMLSHQIGAERMSKLGEYMSGLFYYKKWDKLKKLIDLYHDELNLVLKEIVKIIKK